MLGKSEYYAEICFDFRICPSGNVVAQFSRQRKSKVLHPADEIQVVFACRGITKSDELVDQHAIVNKAQIETDQLTCRKIKKEVTIQRVILKNGGKEFGGQFIKVNFALPVDIEI